MTKMKANVLVLLLAMTKLSQLEAPQALPNLQRMAHWLVNFVEGPLKSHSACTLMCMPASCRPAVRGA